MTNIPTVFEQSMLEYINRARTNPAGEYDVAMDASDADAGIANALQYFGVDMDVYRSQMASYDAVAPLAWNDGLATAADRHSQLMIDMDRQSHNLPGEAGLETRITDAGYSGWSNLSENIFAYTQDALYGHVGFMVDWGYDDADFDVNGARYSDWQNRGDGIQDPPGHRNAILSASLQDIGISALAEDDASTGVGPWVVTQNFGQIGGYNPAQLLGVFIDDADGDQFYDTGEGQGGITVMATNQASGNVVSTTTWNSGGYQMELDSGTYTVQFSGGTLDGLAQYTATIASQNIKLDGFVADVQSASSTIFADGIEALYFPDVSAQVFRLYQGILGREPDHTGHLAWTERLAVGDHDINDVVQGFMGSSEFQSQFGGQDNEGFVTLLYDNVLERSPDTDGLARWVSDLDGGLARSSVVLGFSESAEFRSKTAKDAQDFAQSNSPSGWSDDVYRLYQATLGREPDVTGFENWAGRLGSGMDYLDVANGFVSSVEFQTTYSDLSNAEFVSLLYDNVLERAPDDAGLANWTGRLDDGMAKVDVVRGFAQSSEFVSRTAQDLMDWVLAQGLDDEVRAGAGDTVMAGGTLSDSFVFSPNSSQNTVLDLEVWDFIDLAQFAMSSDAIARSFFAQVDDNVMFDNEAGTTVTFMRTELEIITDEMILI
jgi:serralysin